MIVLWTSESGDESGVPILERGGRFLMFNILNPPSSLIKLKEVKHG